MSTTSFAERLKELRAEKRISGPQLAERIGVSASTVSMWETGERFPRKKYLDSLCEFFNVSYDYLTGVSKFKNPHSLLERYENDYLILLQSDSKPAISIEMEKLTGRALQFSKFDSLTPEHRQAILDMLDMYYEKDTKKQ